MEKLKLSSDRKTTTLCVKHKKGWVPKVKNAFGLPAGPEGSCPGATEWCTDCYAFNIQRVYTNVDRLVKHNLDLLQSCGSNVSKMVSLLQELILSVNWYDQPKVFRWHWNGDIFSKPYSIAIAKTCILFPDIQFWIYTRSFDYVPDLLDIPNLAVYLSTDRYNIDGARNLYNQFPDKLWIASCGDTWEETEQILRSIVNRNAPRCPELTGKTPLVTDEGKGACVECGLCIYGRNHVRFALEKKVRVEEMKGRYEIRDSHNSNLRGMRFTSFSAAQKELSKAYPQERWFIFDRQEKKEVN